jgi:hypothetical protein
MVHFIVISGSCGRYWNDFSGLVTKKLLYWPGPWVLYGRLLPLLLSTLIASEDSRNKEHKAVILPSYLIDLGRRGENRLIKEIYRKVS